MKKKRWSDLSEAQQVAAVVLGVLEVGLLVGALWDLAHRTADEVRGPRAMWAALVFIGFIGPMAYFAVGRKECCCSCCSETRSGSDAVLDDISGGSVPI
jgi:hypothetical protein